MSVTHHPSDAHLGDYAAGLLDQAQQIVIGVHLAHCSRCRDWVRTLERIGGEMLEDLPPSPLAANSGAALARSLPAARELIDNGEPGLPKLLRRYPMENWRAVVPGIQQRTIRVGGAARLFLLKSQPGVRLLRHAHRGLEMSCILTGGYSHDTRHFLPGDYVLGDPSEEHQPVVDPGEPCIALVAMLGSLRWKGVLGFLAQPFIHL